MKTVWGKLKQYFSGQQVGTAHGPILIRVLDETNRSVPIVHVEATFFPSGRTVRGRRVTAQGLCLFPWGRDETRAQVLVQAGDASATTSIDRKNSDRSQTVVLCGLSSNAEEEDFVGPSMCPPPNAASALDFEQD